MISLTRIRNEDTIPARFRGQGRIECELSLVRLQRRGADLDDSVWKHAKPQLQREANGKCAYCESPSDHIAYCDVEHFRPKDHYWWLAYSWENYSFSCQLCNQKFKKAKFPCSGTRWDGPAVTADDPIADWEALAGTLGPDPMDAASVAAYRTHVATEAAELPDPYDPGFDPEQHFAWLADDTVKEVEIRPLTNDPVTVAMHAAVDAHLGLNRQELAMRRWRLWRAVERVVSWYEDEHDPIKKEDMAQALRDQMEPVAEWAGMVRYQVRVLHGLNL